MPCYKLKLLKGKSKLRSYLIRFHVPNYIFIKTYLECGYSFLKKIRIWHNLLITCQIFQQTQECKIPRNKTGSTLWQEMFLWLMTKQGQNPFLSASYDEQTTYSYYHRVIYLISSRNKTEQDSQTIFKVRTTCYSLQNTISE